MTKQRDLWCSTHNLGVFLAGSLTEGKRERAKEGERETDRGREGRGAVLTYSSSFFASSGVLWSPDVLQVKVRNLCHMNVPGKQPTIGNYLPKSFIIFDC